MEGVGDLRCESCVYVIFFDGRFVRRMGLSWSY